MKLFVLGLDGASYRLIMYLLEQGKLPFFKKLKEEGLLKEMRATTPPHTAPGWTTAFTGVSPGRHGIFQFWDTQAFHYIGDYMGSRNVKAPYVWEILNRTGLKTIVVNVPMTYPPKPLNGVMISWPLSNTLQYAYPKDILFKIAEHGGHYATDINHMFHESFDFIDDAIAITKKRIKTIEYLLKNEEWDLFLSVFTEIDRISHYYWRFADERSPYYEKKTEEKLKKAVENIYVETDKAMANIYELLPRDTLFMTISDHGFTVGQLDFYVQTFLMKNGFLKMKEISSDKKCENSWFQMKSNGKYYEVDFNQTAAYMAAPGSYGININMKGRQEYGIVDRGSFHTICEEIIQRLKNIKHPNKEQTLFKDVLAGKMVYQGKYADLAPDIIMIPWNYDVMVHHSIHPTNLFGLPEQNGMHDMDAIFGLYGCQEFVKNCNDIKIEDVTPTILEYFQIKPGDYMDGEGILQLKGEERECRLSVSDIQIKNNSYTEEESKQVSEKLKSLGYL